ncbi:hypothetical protein HHI36_020669 [Cryptolaemus montrouzieri]|uniref:Uncharacterized protein n=1 Tax=Cryptolaemus montrouzieri TaxID=559131 RepID=A0ABD2NBQ6_9CUCU
MRYLYLFQILVILSVFLFVAEAHRVYHRIHVPTKIKTIYHTKIVKVPEHHHYIHEKEKYVPLETHLHHHQSHHKSYSSLKEDDTELEYEQAVNSYEPQDDHYDFESSKFGSDYLESASKKIPKVHKKSKARPRRVKHKIIKLPPN